MFKLSKQFVIEFKKKTFLKKNFFFCLICFRCDELHLFLDICRLLDHRKARTFQRWLETDEYMWFRTSETFIGCVFSKYYLHCAYNHPHTQYVSHTRLSEHTRKARIAKVNSNQFDCVQWRSSFDALLELVDWS